MVRILLIIPLLVIACTAPGADADYRVVDNDISKEGDILIRAWLGAMDGCSWREVPAVMQVVVRNRADWIGSSSSTVQAFQVPRHRRERRYARERQDAASGCDAKADEDAEVTMTLRLNLAGNIAALICSGPGVDQRRELRLPGAVGSYVTFDLPGQDPYAAVGGWKPDGDGLRPADR